MGRHRRRSQPVDMREEWKQEYRKLSNEIHTSVRAGAEVPEEKGNRLKQLGRWLRSQSGE